jgi:DNA-binding NtrC family response regulator
MNAKPLRILVVDDDKNFAHTLCDILHSEGYEAEEVHSVKGAQKILEKQHIDCVLSDVRMPEKSGTDFYQEIKGQYPNLPFILMTAYTPVRSSTRPCNQVS